MKDKSKYVSSVIVSLLAGFIYYQFGQDINADLQNSLKAVLSSNDVDEYMQTDYQSFNSLTKKSGRVTNKKSSKFYIKRKNSIEFKTRTGIIPGDEMVSSLVQAKFKKSVPDKNVDFSTELQHLINKDLCNTTPSKEFKIQRSTTKTEDGIADTKELKSTNNLLHKNPEGDLGNGFEYNFIITKNSSQSGRNFGKKEKVQINTTPYYNGYTSSYEFNSGFTKTEIIKNKTEYKCDVINGNKIKVITPKAPVIKIEDMDEDQNKDFDNDKDSDTPEMNDSSDNDSM